jgi:hypothetical protein
LPPFASKEFLFFLNSRKRATGILKNLKEASKKNFEWSFKILVEIPERTIVMKEKKFIEQLSCKYKDTHWTSGAFR